MNRKLENQLRFSISLTWREAASASLKTATVLIPIRLAVLMTRHAISPLLAIRILENNLQPWAVSLFVLQLDVEEEREDEPRALVEQPKDVWQRTRTWYRKRLPPKYIFYRDDIQPSKGPSRWSLWHRGNVGNALGSPTASHVWPKYLIRCVLLEVSYSVCGIWRRSGEMT